VDYLPLANWIFLEAVLKIVRIIIVAKQKGVVRAKKVAFNPIAQS